jgi:hypothetical protein
MENIQEIIDRAVWNEPDYSACFSRKVEALARGVEELTGLEAVQVGSMDDCPGQYVRIRLVSHAGHSPRMRFEARFYISSKADVFFVYVNDEVGRVRNHRGHPHPLPAGALPEVAQRVIFKIRRFLVETSCREVPYELYDKEAAGYLTQMDGLPATIFEALFAEIV